MSEITVAVCDREESYCDRFAAYLVEHRRGNVAVHTYSCIEAFCQDIKEKVFDVAVLGGGFDAAMDEAVRQGIPVLHLNEEMPIMVAEETKGWAEEAVTVREVFRYQPMDGILHEMQVLTGGKGMVCAASQTTPRQLEVIGVYSPARHEMQMAFSVVYGALLGEHQKVLYVNLLEHSGFTELFGAENRYDVGELVLGFRKHCMTPEFFSRSVYEMEGLSYIPPFGNPANLHEFQPEDLDELLRFVEEKTTFDTVILDFGEGFAQFDQMLGQCSNICCPVRHGYYYECCQQSFTEYLGKSTISNLAERVHEVDLPYSAKKIRGGGDVLRQLLWSEFGDCVRGHLTGVGYDRNQSGY